MQLKIYILWQTTTVSQEDYNLSTLLLDDIKVFMLQGNCILLSILYIDKHTTKKTETDDECQNNYSYSQNNYWYL